MTGAAARGPAQIAAPRGGEILPWEMKLWSAIRERLGVADIGMNPARRSVWLLGAPRTLVRLVRSPYDTRRALQSAGLERQIADTRNTWTWDELEYAVLGTVADVTMRVGVKDPDTSYEEAERRAEVYTEWHVYPVPAPGGPQVAWFSAKQGRWMPPVEFERFTFCAQPPLVPPNDGPAVLHVPTERGRPLPPLMCTHGVNLADLPLLSKCGGALWPSVAVSWRVPPSYGDVVFLLDVRVLETALRTGRRKGTLWMLFPTDAWSLTTRNLLRLEKAVHLERTADRRFWHASGDLPSEEGGGWANRWLQNDLVVERVMDPAHVAEADGSGPPNASTILNAWPAVNRWMRRVVGHHVPRWPRPDADPYAYPPRPDWDNDYPWDVRYPYLELKARGRVPLDRFVACAYPAGAARKVGAILDANGFGGWRIPVKTPLVPKAEHRDAVRAKWAADMTAAILAWAEDPSGTRCGEPQRFGARYTPAGRLTWSMFGGYSIVSGREG